MADDSALLVPITLRALLVNSAVQSSPFELWTNDYSNLNTFEDPSPAAFTNLSESIVKIGVHLHWKLPTALTHGTTAKGSTDAVFPPTPNRWVVVRLASTTGGTNAQSMAAWVIQSDYLGPDGTTPFADPSPSSQPPNIQVTGLGKNWTISQWTGEPATPGITPFLTATGLADVMFTAYQPALLDVYAFYDDMTGVAEGDIVTYSVAGWYSDPSQDPLVRSNVADLDWMILGTPPTSAPTVSVFHALVYDLNWQTKTAPPRADSDASKMQVAIGYTAIDALAAAVAASQNPPGGVDLEMQIAAFLYNAHWALDDPDGQAQTELKIRQGWFGAVPGGTMWDIVAVSQGQQDQLPLGAGAVPPPPELTPRQVDWLATLNTHQTEIDHASRILSTMQAELFSLWWKQQRIGQQGSDVWNLEQTYGVDIASILSNIEAALSGAPDSYLAQVERLKTFVSKHRGDLPVPTSPESILKFSKMIPENTDGSLLLKPTAVPPFFQPNDPVVLITGFTPPAGPDPGKILPCRLTGAAVTGVEVVLNRATTTVGEAQLSAIIQVPTISTANFAPSTAAAIPPALRALAIEAFFVDPNNAASIVSNGLNSSDPTAISNLQSAMAKGTAQVSTIATPLQALFAFAPWAQAWSPLYLEWEMTWFPSVSPTLIGGSNPPSSQPPNFPAKDNFAFDPTSWSFDGSDDVAQRGSEYYQWQGSDIWAPAGSVTPQTYVGRTFLTPQSTTLLGDRLDGLLTLLPTLGSAVPGDAQESIQELRRLLDGIQFLSQSLSGFNDSFLSRLFQLTPSAPSGPIAKAIGDQDRGVPDVSLGDQDYSFGAGMPFFFPIRGGFFQFEKLQVVDAFGQVLNLLVANGNPVNPGSPALADYFFPILAQGLVSPTVSGLTAQRLVNQAPRVVQPSRLNLILVDAEVDTAVVGFSPGANPICGWLLPNVLDRSIAVYNPAGDPLGELLVLADVAGTQAVTWLAAPDSPDPITDPVQIANPHLSALLAAFLSASGGIPTNERVAAFQAFFFAIDEALWTVDPRGNRGDRDLAALIGRPLALVRAQLQFELYGQPAYNQSWRDTLQAETAGLTDPSLTFPIRLGSAELLDDGLAGYFTGDVYTSFNAVSPSAKNPSPFVVAIAPGNYIALPFDYPNYSSQALSMLVDPRGSVHATTGILPTLDVKIPSQFVDAPLSKMAVTFRIGPVLTDPTAIRLPFPAARQGLWSWISRTGPADEWSVGPILAANGKARLADAPPHLIDGWLKYSPSKVSVNVPLLAVGKAPSAAAVSPASAYLFVANSGDNTVTVIDAQTFRAVGKPIAVGGGPGGIVVLPDNSRAFVANTVDGTLSVIVVPTLQALTATIPVGKSPVGVAVSPINSLVFVANSGENSISVINGQTLEPQAGSPISVGVSPVAVAVSPDNSHAFVANSGDGTVTVIDAQGLFVVGSPIQVGTKPSGVAISPDGSHVFVANSADGTVTVINALSLAVVGQPITVGTKPVSLAVTPDGAYVLVVNSGDGTVTIIDANTLAVANWSPLKVGTGPSGVAVSPDNTYSFISNSGDGTVTVLFPSASPGRSLRDGPRSRMTPSTPEPTQVHPELETKMSNKSATPANGSITATGDTLLTYTIDPNPSPLAAGNTGSLQIAFGILVKSQNYIYVSKITFMFTIGTNAQDLTSVATGITNTVSEEWSVDDSVNGEFVLTPSSGQYVTMGGTYSTFTLSGIQVGQIGTAFLNITECSSTSVNGPWTTSQASAQIPKFLGDFALSSFLPSSTDVKYNGETTLSWVGSPSSDSMSVSVELDYDPDDKGKKTVTNLQSTDNYTAKNLTAEVVVFTLNITVTQSDQSQTRSPQLSVTVDQPLLKILTFTGVLLNGGTALQFAWTTSKHTDHVTLPSVSPDDLVANSNNFTVQISPTSPLLKTYTLYAFSASSADKVSSTLTLGWATGNPVAVAPSLTNIALSTDQTRLYVLTNSNGSSALEVLDAQTLLPVPGSPFDLGNIPFTDLAPSVDGQTIFLNCPATPHKWYGPLANAIYAANVDNPQPQFVAGVMAKEIKFPNDVCSQNIAISADGTILYFTIFIPGNPDMYRTLSALDITNNFSGIALNFQATRSAAKPACIAASSKGNLYIGLPETGQVIQVDPSSPTAVNSSLPTPIANPTGIAVSADGEIVYVTDQSSGLLWTLDATTLEPLTEPSQLDIGSAGIAVSSNGSIYVANNTNSTVSLLQVASNLIPLPPRTSTESTQDGPGQEG